MVAAKPYDVKLIQECLELDPEGPTGVRWKVERYRRSAGLPAGCKNNTTGYWQVKLNYRTLRLHRVIWVLEHGEDPFPLTVDHVDHDLDNNDVSNLRLATQSQQNSNRRPYRHNRRRH